IDTLADMEEAFAGIPHDRVSVSLTINGMAAAITAMYYAVAEKQGAAADRVVTTPQNDILKEFIARGTWIYPVEPSLRLVADLIEFSAKHYPRSNPVSVCGYHIREAGCTTAQEMAYGLEIAAAYVELMLARGIPVGEGAAHRAPHHADLRRGVWRRGHGRPARGLVLRRGADECHGDADPRGDGPGRAHGRHRRGRERRRAPGRGRAPGLPVRAEARLGRDPEGRSQLPRRRQGRGGRPRGRAVRLRPAGGRGAGRQARADPS